MLCNFLERGKFMSYSARSANILDIFRKPQSTILCIVIIIVICKLSSLRQRIFLKRVMEDLLFWLCAFFLLVKREKFSYYFTTIAFE